MPKLAAPTPSVMVKILFCVLNSVIVLTSLVFVITAFFVAKTVPPGFYSDLRSFGDEYYESFAYLCMWLVSIVMVMAVVGVMGFMNVFVKNKNLMEVYTWGMLLGGAVMVIFGIDCFVMADYVSQHITWQMKLMIFSNITFWRPMIRAQNTYRCCGISDKEALNEMIKLGLPDCCDTGVEKTDWLDQRPQCYYKDHYKMFCDWIDVTKIGVQISSFGTYLILFASYCSAIIVFTVILDLLEIKKMPSSNKEKPGLAIAPRNE